MEQSKIIKKYHLNGKLKEEYFENNGKKEGLYKSYWSNGQLYNEVNYIGGKMNGIYNTYYHNGEKRISSICVNDKHVIIK